MEGAGVGGVWPVALGHDSGREEGGKGAGRPVGPIPGRGASGGGPWKLGHGGGRRLVAMVVVVPLWGSTEAGSWGKRGREVRRLYCAPYLGQRWREAAWPRRPAAAGGGASGGGDVQLGRGHMGAEQLMELKGDAEGLFIAKEWRWSGRGVRGDRRAARWALMEFGQSFVL